MKTTHRSITIDGNELEYTEDLTDLYKKIYKNIIEGNRFGIETALPSIEAAYNIRHLPVTKAKELFHSYLL